MTTDEYAQSRRELPEARRRVFDAFLEHGPLTNHEVDDLVGDSSRGKCTLELRRLGLVRPAGRRGGRRLWEATPPAEVEAMAEAASQLKPRLRPIEKRDLDSRVSDFRKLLTDPEVQDALLDPEGTATKRERQKARTALEQERRNSRRRLREAEAGEHPLLEVMRLRDSLLQASSWVASLRLAFEEERERRTLIGESGVHDGEWETVLKAVADLDRRTDDMYESVARMIDAPSRREADVEYDDDEIEDADFTPAGQLALPPGEEVSEVA